MPEIRVCWDDLSLEKQRDIADVLEMEIDDVEKANNWDVFPITIISLPKRGK